MEKVIEKKLEEFKVKYYQSKLIRGALILLSLIMVASLFLFTLEFLFRFNSVTRTIIFYLSLGVGVVLIYFLVIRNLLQILSIGRRSLDDREAALEIGNFFPEISDKLLNTLQLQALSSEETSLIAASISQKIKELRPIPFVQAVDFRVNMKYARYLAFIMLSIVVTGLSVPSLLTEGSTRIINYNRDFIPKAPFQFVFESDGRAFRNESYKLNLLIDGNVLPESAYIELNDRLLKLQKEAEDQFSYEITNIQNDLRFRFFAGGFNSKQYVIEVFERPELSRFNVRLNYPAHTGLKLKTVSNVGSFILPEGTEVTWEIVTQQTDSASIFVDNELEIAPYSVDNQLFTFQHVFKSSRKYEIALQNNYSANLEELEYKIDIIKDEYPTIQVDFFADTILYDYVILSGLAGDDYGITGLKAHYAIDGNEMIAEIPFNKLQKENSFFYRLDLENISYEENRNLSLYVSVTDNDGVNGLKTTKSQIYSYDLPDPASIEKSLEKQSQETESQLNKSIEEAESINEKLKQLEDRLKSKKSIEWQEEKLLDDILKQRSDIEQSIEELRQKFDELRNNEDKFNNRSKGIQEKAKKLQELMDEILDEKTKAMYEELQNLLREKSNLNEIRDQLRDLMPSEEDMEKELERALELFKRLKLESELEKTSNKLEELGDKQQDLGDKTSEKDSNMEDVTEEQEEINESFEDIQEKLDDINELNQDLKNPEPLENTMDEQEEINEKLQEIMKQLQQQNRSGGSQMQKKTGEQMKQLGQNLEQMQMNMEMEMMMENMENLRNILDNLVKLSFKQEELIEAFREVTQVDPRFVELSQEQLKLKDDAKVIEDSLLALAERVVQISSFVTREVSEVNRNIDASLEELKSRNRSRALSNQQFAMTSINNLALLLDDVLQQMQMAMAEAMGKPSKGQKGNQELPNLKQLQQQLSEQIKELKDSGMKGRKLSEQLAKMAAEQELLRNQLQKLQERLEGQQEEGEATDNLGKAIEEMEKNEIDLVNKRLTQQLINRQEEIMTRLLEAENALREQEFDDEREGEAATNYEKRVPKAFEEYLKAKQKEIELLKSVPLELNPFYKKEVNDYFRRLSNQN